MFRLFLPVAASTHAGTRCFASMSSTRKLKDPTSKITVETQWHDKTRKHDYDLRLLIEQNSYLKTNRQDLFSDSMRDAPSVNTASEQFKRLK